VAHSLLALLFFLCNSPRFRKLSNPSHQYTGAEEHDQCADYSEARQADVRRRIARRTAAAAKDFQRAWAFTVITL